MHAPDDDAAAPGDAPRRARDRRARVARVAAVGGEAPSPRLVRAFGGRGGGFALRVVYGVTECCVYQCGREAEIGDVGAPLTRLTTVAIADGEVLLGGPLVEGASLAAVRVARRLEARLAWGKDFLGREEASSNDAFDPRKLVAAPSVRAYAASLARRPPATGDDAADDDVEAAAPGTADDVLEDDARDDDVEAAAPGTADDVLEDAVSEARGRARSARPKRATSPRSRPSSPPSGASTTAGSGARSA
ncbi:hypothetical protein SO694_00029390 [Aureococcus anophagefferens]|uniref:AMP-dependent synthetase/ligase domain-containing protein n=1 Tax=Aureococcus anophagefferens TaxID=44056 RepID=A0ABR1FVZ4_AURAN